MKKIAVIFFLLAAAFPSTFAQTTVITGVVQDSKTKEIIPFVNVFFSGTQIGVTSDLEGRYSIQTDQPYKQLEFSYVGYKTIKRNLKRGIKQSINVNLSPDTKLLREVVVKSGKVRERYRNKGNPAVNLIREVVNHKAENHVEGYDYVQYEEYEKLEMSLTSKLGPVKNPKFREKYSFFFENRDTTKLDGYALLPIYMQEIITDKYFRKKPKKWKKIVKATKKVSFDEFVDTSGLGYYLDQLYQSVDIYDADISLLGNRFLSPISDAAPTFYKFYLIDTVEMAGEKLYALQFVPRNNTDFLFQGTLYITANDQYAVQHLDMMVNKNINLNWVRSLNVTQDFDKNEDQHYNLKKSIIGIDFAVTKKKGGGFYGERTVSLKKLVTNQPQPSALYEGADVEDNTKKNEKDDEFWAQHRHDTLSRLEANAYINADSVQKLPAFKRFANITTLLLSGYQKFRFWELGPITTFFAGNMVEGFRMKIGGRTTTALHKHIYLKPYVAYGFKDERWKYYVEGTYSFTGKFPIEFPIRALQVSYQEEIKVPGQELEFLDENNFLLSFRRGRDDKRTYNNVWNVNYQHEFENHFSFRVGLKHLTQSPAGTVSFTVSEPLAQNALPRVTTFEASLGLRWAPKEKFYQGKTYRSIIRSKYPIISAQLVSGIDGVLGGQYDYHNITLNIQKRFYLSQIGFTDIFLEGGYVFGTVPFPFLKIHRANQSYSYQFRSYNLMNALEFVSDRYTSVQLVHHFNGFFLNKIPLIKKLKWREILSFKALYGGVRNENIPTEDNALFEFLRRPDGTLETYTLEQLPYMEISIGIENIFNVLRIDVVRRLTYLDHPNTDAWGIRARLRFYF